MFYYYLIGCIAGLIALAGIMFIVHTSGGNRYQRKQLRKLYKRARKERLTFPTETEWSNN